jgi:hypothetical protein
LKKLAAISITLVLFTAAAFPVQAAEKKDHVCFRVVDANRDGRVTFQEFEKIYGNDTEAFERADGDKDNHLTHEEYHQMLGHGSS